MSSFYGSGGADVSWTVPDVPDSVWDDGEGGQEEDDQQLQEEDRLWQGYCHMAAGLDEEQIHADVCAQLHDDPQSPIRPSIEEFKAMPQFDWQHPLIRPSQAEVVGRYVLGLLAEVMHESIGAAMAREG
jgi:hypothetical protein